MAKYIPYDYNQNLMVVINFQDQLQTGTFEYALQYLVTHKLDLSIFDQAFKNNGEGRPAYRALRDQSHFWIVAPLNKSQRFRQCCHHVRCFWSTKLKLEYIWSEYRTSLKAFLYAKISNPSNVVIVPTLLRHETQSVPL